MYGLVRGKHERRCSRACGADVSFRDVTIKIIDRRCDQECEWRHSPEARAEIWEKWVSWVPASEEDGWLSLARRGLAAGFTRDMGGGRWKIHHRKIVSLSLCRKTFKLKGNKKGFVPELRSREIFSVSGFLCYLYMSYEHSMNVSRTHVWLCYSCF